MPGRKQEAEQSQKRLRRSIAKTIDSPVFREHVRDLREVLHIDRVKREEWCVKIQEHKKGLMVEKPIEFPSGWQPFESKTLLSEIGEEVLWNRVRAVWMVQYTEGRECAEPIPLRFHETRRVDDQLTG